MSKKALILIGVALLALVYMGMCMMAPSIYSFKKEVKITGPYKMVYVVINDMKDWPKWFSWKKDDPGLEINLGGRDMHIGASFTFKSSVLGKGQVQLTEAYQDSLISARVKSSKIPNDLRISWQIIPEGTKSVYVNFNARLVGKIPFIKRGMYLGLQSKLNKTFESDLEGMKSYIENLVKGDFGVEKITFPGQKYFGKLDIISNTKIPQFYAKYYPIIYKMIDSMQATITGPPVGLIFDWEAESGLVAIMAALPIDRKLPNIPGWSYTDVPGAECLRMKNFGSYLTLRSAHAKMNYLMDNSPYTLNVPMIEEYVTSPSQEPDTSKWQTNIYYLLDKRGGYLKTVEQKYTLEDVIKMEEEDRMKNLKSILTEVKK